MEESGATDKKGYPITLFEEIIMVPVMLDPKKCKLGERYKLWITGFVGEWVAKVIAIDRDGFPLLEAETWPLLKKGDYVLIEVMKILQK